jgi:hypothetical protein
MCDRSLSLCVYGTSSIVPHACCYKYVHNLSPTIVEYSWLWHLRDEVSESILLLIEYERRKNVGWCGRRRRIVILVFTVLLPYREDSTGRSAVLIKCNGASTRAITMEKHRAHMQQSISGFFRFRSSKDSATLSL